MDPEYPDRPREPIELEEPHPLPVTLGFLCDGLRWVPVAATAAKLTPNTPLELPHLAYLDAVACVPVCVRACVLRLMKKVSEEALKMQLHAKVDDLVSTRKRGGTTPIHVSSANLLSGASQLSSARRVVSSGRKSSPALLREQACSDAPSAGSSGGPTQPPELAAASSFSIESGSPSSSCDVPNRSLATRVANRMRQRSSQRPSTSEASEASEGGDAAEHLSISAAGGVATEDGGPTVLWRGMRGLVPTPHFLKNGGCELAPMSTTKSLEIAVRYATNADKETLGVRVSERLVPEQRRKTALLFKLKIDSFIDMGADLTFLSAFPHEQEYLFAPLTLIQPERGRRPRRFLYGETLFIIIDATVRMSAA
jgi:hypothetical protein